MVVTMDALERAGLAERRPSPTDRRARIIAVTPAGEDVVERGEQIVTRSTPTSSGRCRTSSASRSSPRCKG